MVDILDYKDKIEAALKYGGGTHLFEDVADAVIDGRMQMWVNGETVAITEIIVYPRKKVLHVFIWQWGQSICCTGMTLAGRKGWMKLMGKFGFKPTLYVMEKVE